MRARTIHILASSSVMLVVVFAAVTYLNLEPPPRSLMAEGGSVRYTDRFNSPLTVTYTSRWNTNDVLPLHKFPVLLRDSVIRAEDQNFFDHAGVDWRARVSAVYQNVLAGRAVRGASTITEQVVRLHHDRPRTLWTRWLEGWEAYRLEAHFDKSEILAFYLNQVPYGRQRRGVVQGARVYFNRDLAALNEREILTLATLIRAPSRWDPIDNPDGATAAVGRLAAQLRSSGSLSHAQYLHAVDTPMAASNDSALSFDASHFLRFIGETTTRGLSDRPHRTTLNGPLQNQVAGLLRQRLLTLKNRRVQHGAALVFDHQNNEVLAWVSAGLDREPAIDAVLAPRQPGSALKPFLYALALEKGWTASSIIDDSPLTQAVGSGAHRYRNYSQRFYGPLRVREALANSLNIPAIRTMEYVGRNAFLDQLRALGFRSLSEHPDQYGDGLALGNGEVSLYELVNAYATLARGGESVTPNVLISEHPVDKRQRVVAADVAQLIGDILSDSRARELEFGGGSLLDFPVNTAVKTGTANNYTDAWSVGYNYRYTVGVWLGNLDRTPMREVSGAVGPALVLRGIFSELNRNEDTRPLASYAALESTIVCRISGHRAGPNCPGMVEKFRAGTQPQGVCPLHGVADFHVKSDGHDKIMSLNEYERLAITMPTPGLIVAQDPRIPDSRERLEFSIQDAPGIVEVRWVLDDVEMSVTKEPVLLWPLKKGVHKLVAKVSVAERDADIELGPVRFVVR